MTLFELGQLAVTLCKKIALSFTKTGLIGSFFASMYLATQGIHNFYYAAIIFVLVDTVTGTLASLMKKEKFRSRRFYEGAVAKLFIHLMMITLLWKLDSLFQVALPISTNFLALFITVCICTYEFSSIVENVVVIFPNMTYLKTIRAMLKRIVKKQGENIEKALEGDLKGEEKSEAEPKAEEGA